MAISTPSKVGERLGISVGSGRTPDSRRFSIGVTVPRGVPADSGPALEADIKRVADAAREVERKWNGDRT